MIALSIHRDTCMVTRLCTALEEYGGAAHTWENEFRPGGATSRGKLELSTWWPPTGGCGDNIRQFHHVTLETLIHTDVLAVYYDQMCLPKEGKHG